MIRKFSLANGFWACLILTKEGIVKLLLLFLWKNTRRRYSLKPLLSALNRLSVENPLISK
jgi:hypothetical protein